jgi:hypothetical protein
VNTIISKLVERWASKKLGVVGLLFAFCMQPEVQTEIAGIFAGVCAIWTVIQGQIDKAKMEVEKAKALKKKFDEQREDKPDA